MATTAEGGGWSRRGRGPGGRRGRHHGCARSGKAEAVGTGIDDGSHFEGANEAGFQLVGWTLGKGSVRCGEEDAITDAEAEFAAAAVSMLALAILGGGDVCFGGVDGVSDVGDEGVRGGDSGGRVRW